MSNPIALIVDDEPDILELLDITLGRMHIQTREAGDLSAARRLLAQQHFDLCLTDMRLPDGDGIELVRQISRDYPDLPVAVITAHGSMETAIQALKAGAFDFASKPIDLQMLRRLVQSALKLQPSSPPSNDDQPREADGASMLFGQSAASQRIHSMIGKLARSQAPVYISGESGTGKELAARLIHQQGPRREGEFVAVNCGAIPQELMESEFFGHLKGSFTGAVSDQKGLFQSADGGTLFLDEVADLPLPMQVKLLRAIQEKRVRPVGGQKEIPVDARIISATHKELSGLVEEGAFRQDLFYRINVIELHISPLRERHEDIPLLVEHFLERIARRNGSSKPELQREALQALLAYPYPGNIRELENILERAVALCEADTISLDDILLPEASTATLAADAGLPLESYLEQVEKAEIVKALEATKWNRTAAARRLGMSFRQLRYRLSKLGIE